MRPRREMVSDRDVTNSAENHGEVSHPARPAHARLGAPADRPRRMATECGPASWSQDRAARYASRSQGSPARARHAAPSRRCAIDRTRVADADVALRGPRLAEASVPDRRVQLPIEPRPRPGRGRRHGNAVEGRTGIRRPSRTPREPQARPDRQAVRHALSRTAADHASRRSQHTALRAPQPEAPRTSRDVRSILDRSVLERGVVRWLGDADPQPSRVAGSSATDRTSSHLATRDRLAKTRFASVRRDASSGVVARAGPE